MSTSEYYVCAIPFSHLLDKVYLLGKVRPHWQSGLLNGPGGKVHDNETPAQAVCREFLEETGVETEQSKWLEIDRVTADNTCVVFYTIQLEEGQTPKTTTDENVWTVYWKNYTQRGWEKLDVIDDLPSMIYRAYVPLSNVSN